MRKIEIDNEILIDLYVGQKKSMYQIARELGIGVTPVLGRMKEYGIERRTQIEGIKLSRERITIKPNFENQKAISYILGVLKGDGSACFQTSGGWIVKLRQTRINFADSFEDALEDIGLHPHSFKKDENVKQGFVWCTYAYSKLFVEWYQNLKLKDIEEFVNGSIENKKEFIRGFYESEGYFQRVRKGELVHMSNTNERLANFVCLLIDNLGFNPHIYKYKQGKASFGKKDYYRISILSKENAANFFRQINPCIKNPLEKNT